MFQLSRIGITVLMCGFFLAVGYSEASAGQFHVRNCVPKRAFVCAYNSNDSSLATASEAAGLHSGKHKSFKCSTKRCKVFIGFSKTDVGALIGGAVAGSFATAAVGGTVIGGGVYLGEMVTAAAADEILVAGVAGPVGMAAVGVLVTAIAVDASVEINAACKKIIKKVKHSKNAKAVRDSRISGHHYLSINNDPNKGAYLSIGKGDSCPAN